MTPIKVIFTELWREKSVRWALVLILGALIYSLAFSTRNANKSTAAATTSTESTDIDTLIPAGFVLVPLQLQNIEALQALVGAYARVDLYAEGHTQPVARGLPLVRSPRDPSQVAVLVPQDQSPNLVKVAQKPLLAVVQNRNEQQYVRKTQSQGRVIWEDPL